MSCLGYLREEADKIKECMTVLREAEDGKLELIISSLTIAEVLHCKGQKPVPKAIRDKIRKFFKRSIFIVADVDRFIAEHAQELYWDHGIEPKDAIHVATALATECEHLDTFDGPLMRHSKQVGGTPPLIICPPGTGLQPSLFDD